MNVVTSVSQYESCKLWIDSLRSKEYKNCLYNSSIIICRFHNTNPDELICLKHVELKKMVIKYILELKKKSKNTAGKPIRGETSVNSIKKYTAGIKSFLDEQEISLPWKKIARFYPEEVTNDYRWYTRQEISKLLSMADLRDRCIILLLASSGIRVGAIPSLTIKSLKKLDEGLGLQTVYGESKKSRYVTLVTPECMTSIEEYKELRRKRGEKLTEKSYLIRDKYAIYSKRINSPISVKEPAINVQIRHLIRKAGLPFNELQPDHAARKYRELAQSFVMQKHKLLKLNEIIGERIGSLIEEVEIATNVKLNLLYIADRKDKIEFLRWTATVINSILNQDNELKQVQLGTSKIRMELADAIKFENALKNRIEELNIKLKESNNHRESDILINEIDTLDSILGRFMDLKYGEKTRAIEISEANQDFRRANRLRKQINKIQDMEDEIGLTMHN